MQEYSSAALWASKLTIPSGHKCSWIAGKHGHKQCSNMLFQEVNHFLSSSTSQSSTFKRTEHVWADCSACCIPSVYCMSACRKVRLKKEKEEEGIKSFLSYAQYQHEPVGRQIIPYLDLGSQHSDPSAQPWTTDLYFPEITSHPDHNIQPMPITPAHFVSFLNTQVTQPHLC